MVSDVPHWVSIVGILRLLGSRTPMQGLCAAVSPRFLQHSKGSVPRPGHEAERMGTPAPGGDDGVRLDEIDDDLLRAERFDYRGRGVRTGDDPVDLVGQGEGIEGTPAELAGIHDADDRAARADHALL